MKRLALVVVATMAAACGGASTEPSTIATPAATVTTETFTGTVQPPINGQGQFDIHTFTVATAGALTVTLTAAGPPPTITMGIGVGSVDSAGVCTVLSGAVTQMPASTTPQLSGTLTNPGTYCVVVYDSGNVLQTVTYSITVVHT